MCELERTKREAGRAEVAVLVLVRTLRCDHGVIEHAESVLGRSLQKSTSRLSSAKMAAYRRTRLSVTEIPEWLGLDYRPVSCGRLSFARPSRFDDARAAVAVALAIVLAVGLGARPAAARARITFLHRVDLATGAVTKVAEIGAGRTDRVPRGRAPRGWWRATSRVQRMALDVFVDDQVDVRESDPERAIKARALVVSAGGVARLRLPPPDVHGRLVWWALGGDVLVVEWQSGSGGRLRLGIDLTRGAVGWRRAVSAGPFPQARAAGAGRVFVYTALELEAVDVATGATLWRQPRVADDQGADVETCDLGADRWVFASNVVAAFDPASGARKWRAPLGPGVPRWCVVQDDSVLVAWRTAVGSGHERDVLAALDARDGRVVWRNPAVAPIAQGRLVAGGALATWSPSPEGLSRVDPISGKTMWTLPGVGSTEVELLKDGDWFFPGACMRVDARTGAVRWRLAGVGSCRRRGETALYSAAVAREGLGSATITLRRYSFDRQSLIRESVVHRYGQFFDTAGAEVTEVGPSAAIVVSDFVVLD